MMDAMASRQGIVGCLVAGCVVAILAGAAYWAAVPAAKYHNAIAISDEVSDLAALFHVRYGHWPTSIAEIEIHMSVGSAHDFDRRLRAAQIKFEFSSEAEAVTITTRAGAGDKLWEGKLDPPTKPTLEQTREARDRFP